MTTEENLITNETLLLLEIRKSLYFFLSTSFFHIPNEETIRMIIERKLFAEFPLAIDSPEFQEALSLLNSWSQDINEENWPEVLSVLRQDYTRLFLGPGHLPAPPWESVYLTEEKLTFGEPTLQVRAFFRRFGVEFERQNTEPDDHFGLEMEFMAQLIAKQIAAIADGQELEANLLQQAQLTFLQEHPLRWLEDFTANIISAAQTPYYRGLALLARSYLTWDYATLQEQAD
jgi:TorA maturation chaperone TorD